MVKESNRRDFLRKTSIAAGAFSVFGISQFLKSCEQYIAHDFAKGIDIEIDVNSIEFKRYLTKTGAGLMKKFDGINNGVPVIIVRVDDENYRCFSSMCTHNNCFGREGFHSPDPDERDKSDVRPPIGTTLEARSIVCKCHGSRFDPFDEGKPYQGPAERPLTQYKCDFNTDTGVLTIHF